MKKSRLICALLGFLLAAYPAWARPELCEAAAVTAANEVGVPVEVMLALSLTETGRSRDGRMRPWPWTANAEGRGYWFDTREEAAGFARQLQARGQNLFDLGCFQINWHWHGRHFTRPEELLDPLTAGRYAARLMASLHDEFGSWEGAAGAYHSRIPQNADRYRARFSEIRAGLRNAPPPSLPPVTLAAASPVANRERINTFPLLAGASGVAGASLVPSALPSARPLFEALP